MISKKPLQNFSYIPNNLILDKHLSAGAINVMLYLLTLPDNWTINNADVMQKLGIKTSNTMAKYWKELIKSGWIYRHRIKNIKGHFGEYIYQINSKVDL